MIFPKFTMIKEINMKEFDFKKYVAELTDEELVGEVLSWDFSSKTTDEELLEAVKKNKISCFFANSLSIEQIEFLKNAIKENSKSPCLITADVERGPILYPELKNYSTSMMSLGAANDPSLAFEIGKYTARLCRSIGIGLTLSPVIDINYNAKNPVTNTRAASDDPDTVLSAACSYGRGMRSEGNLAITLKHFPGDGRDDRNQHFCTTVNDMTKDEWMATYGRLYKTMIAEGAEAVMSAHIALPWCDPTFDECGNMPASLSKTLMTDLLKGELGFDGCIISDAMSMVGTAARVPIERLSIEFLRSGGDLVLFPEKEDHKRILEALRSGYLERERLVDAAERVVKLKAKLGLFDGREYNATEDDIKTVKSLLEKAAEKSVTLVRDVDGILPLKLDKGAKVLAITLSPNPKDHPEDVFPAFANELFDRGYEVIRMTNPTHYRIDEVIDTVDAVFVTSIIDTTNCTGNSLRLGWNNMMTFWRGYIFKNKNLVFISLGDPYKLTELPFLKCYINSYVKSGAALKAAVAACLGEKEFTGKSPVKLN